MKLTPEIENVLIPNIQKVDKIKVQIDEMAQAGKTDTQKFKRLKSRFWEGNVKNQNSNNLKI